MAVCGIEESGVLIQMSICFENIVLLSQAAESLLTVQASAKVVGIICNGVLEI